MERNFDEIVYLGLFSHEIGCSILIYKLWFYYLHLMVKYRQRLGVHKYLSIFSKKIERNWKITCEFEDRRKIQGVFLDVKFVSFKF